MLWLILKVLGWAYLSILALWIIYIICMWLIRARDRGEITGFWKVPAYAFVAVGEIADWVVNWTAMTLVMTMVCIPAWRGIEWPATWKELVTGRFNRYKEERTGWHYAVGTFLCKYCLDPFAKNGRHCEEIKL